MKPKINLDEPVNYVDEEQSAYDSNRDFISLETWKKASKVKLFFYEEVLPLIPGEEKFGLNLKIRKASVSSTANISEGYGRYHYQEGIQFYRISRGSLYELKDHLISCLDFGFIDKEMFEVGITLIEDAKITLNGYIGYVKKQKSKN